MIVGRSQKFLSLCRLGLLSCSLASGSLARPTTVLTTYHTHSIRNTLQLVPYNKCFFFSFFVPRSHSKASKRHLSLTWKSLFFLFSKIGIFRNSEFENRTLVSKIRVVNGNFFPKIRVWKPKFVFKTRSLKYRSLFSKISVCKSGSLSKSRVWKKEFDNTVVEPLYNVFENKPPILQNQFWFSKTNSNFRQNKHRFPCQTQMSF